MARIRERRMNFPPNLMCVCSVCSYWYVWDAVHEDVLFLSVAVRWQCFVILVLLDFLRANRLQGILAIHALALGAWRNSKTCVLWVLTKQEAG